MSGLILLSWKTVNPADLQGHELAVQRLDRQSWKFFCIYQ